MSKDMYFFLFLVKEIGSVLTERDCDRERKVGEIKRGREVEKGKKRKDNARKDSS